MKPQKKLLVFALFLIITGATESFGTNQIVVLQYHHFGIDTPASTSISPSLFDQHIAYLAENNFHVLDLEEALLSIQQGKPLPSKSVAVTIDDGYRSVYSEVFPRFKKRGWPFTVFVTTESVDEKHSIVMTWDQMREMQKKGVSFSPHSHTHPYMIKRLPEESLSDWKIRMMNDIGINRKRLEEELGSTSKLFAYPYGEYDLETKRLISEMGLIGVGQQSGVIWKYSDFSALPRFPMSGIYAEMNGFKTKVNALPMPVKKVTPESPVIENHWDAPVLQIEFLPADYSMNLNSLSCFVSGQGRVEVEWTDKSKTAFSIKAPKKIPLGRSKYNCTARHNSQNRFFWFSRQWIHVDGKR